MNEDFEKYMASFKELPLKEKQTIALEQLKALSILTKKMCDEIGVPNQILLSSELIDVMKSDYTEDDFVEAVVALVSSVQNSINDFSLKLTDISENL